MNIQFQKEKIEKQFKEMQQRSNAKSSRLEELNQYKKIK